MPRYAVALSHRAIPKSQPAGTADSSRRVHCCLKDACGSGMSLRTRPISLHISSDGQ